jgi:hypothetical protein
MGLPPLFVVTTVMFRPDFDDVIDRNTCIHFVRGVSTIRPFNAEARRLHPPQGRMPATEVALFMRSPSPTSSFIMKPGSCTRKGRPAWVSVICFDLSSLLTTISSLGRHGHVTCLSVIAHNMERVS